MIIRGNTLCTNMPRSDYGQTDPASADFVRNKPDEAIALARQTAEDAANAARRAREESLPLTGGTLTGALTVPEPSQDSHPATKGYVDGRHRYLELSLPASGWEGEDIFTQTLTVPGILATDRPHYGVLYTGEPGAYPARKEGFACIDDLVTGEGTVTFFCFEDKPGVDLTLQLEVNR